MAFADLVLRDVEFDPAAASLRAALHVPAAHPILRGHFPGAPLVPGVLLLDAVRRAAETARGAPFSIAEVVDVRFARPLAPDEPARLTADWRDGEGGGVEVGGEWQSAAGRIATFTLRLAPRTA